MAKLSNALYFIAAAGFAGVSAQYNQLPSGQASFTHYSGCAQAACGYSATSGFTAAINQLSYGSPAGLGPGDACGRCFAVTATADPYAPNYTGPFGPTIVVKVTDLCPIAGNEVWCGQQNGNPLNQFGKPFHFDLCEDSGAAAPFFPSGHGALTGNFTEVPCSQWTGTDSTNPLWQGACIAGENAPLWPGASGCGNQGTAPGGTAPPPTSAPITTPSSKPTTVPTSPSSTPSSAPSQPAGSVPIYGQCGGINWTGATACAAPNVCKVINPYYSQCLPA